MREEPIFRKCCFYIPLRSCLHTWAAVKIIADVSVSVFLMLMIMILYGYDRNHLFDDFSLLHAFAIIIVVLLIDFAFMIVLGVGLCKKSVKTVHVFYYYNIIMLIVGPCILLAVYIFLIIQSRDYMFQIIYPMCGVTYLCLDICIALTAKSEMIKLRNKEQYEFVKMPTLRTDSQNTEQVPIVENMEYT